MTPRSNARASPRSDIPHDDPALATRSLNYIDFTALYQGDTTMLIPILKSAALLAGAAGFTYALLNGTAASPVRSGALQMLSRVAPETACQLDTMLCLQRHEAEL